MLASTMSSRVQMFSAKRRRNVSFVSTARPRQMALTDEEDVDPHRLELLPHFLAHCPRAVLHRRRCQLNSALLTSAESTHVGVVDGHLTSALCKELGNIIFQALLHPPPQLLRLGRSTAGVEVVRRQLLGRSQHSSTVVTKGEYWCSRMLAFGVDGRSYRKRAHPLF